MEASRREERLKQIRQNQGELETAIANANAEQGKAAQDIEDAVKILEDKKEQIQTAREKKESIKAQLSTLDTELGEITKDLQDKEEEKTTQLQNKEKLKKELQE